MKLYLPLLIQGNKLIGDGDHNMRLLHLPLTLDERNAKKVSKMEVALWGHGFIILHSKNEAAQLKWAEANNFKSTKGKGASSGELLCGMRWAIREEDTQAVQDVSTWVSESSDTAKTYTSKAINIELAKAKNKRIMGEEGEHSGGMRMGGTEGGVPHSGEGNEGPLAPAKASIKRIGIIRTLGSSNGGNCEKGMHPYAGLAGSPVVGLSLLVQGEAKRRQVSSYNKRFRICLTESGSRRRSD